MRFGLLLSALVIGPACAASPPGADVIKTCVMAESTSPQVTFTEVPVREIDELEDPESGITETTVRIHKDRIGTWESTSHAFGIVYHASRIPLDRVRRLSSEKPSPFKVSLADWGIVSAGARSYICIAFNFEGLGQSGAFQNVRGVYLVDRNAKGPRAFYTVGQAAR